MSHHAAAFLSAARGGFTLRRSGLNFGHDIALDRSHPVPVSAAFARMERRAFAAKGKTAKGNHHGKRK